MGQDIPCVVFGVEGSWRQLPSSPPALLPAFPKGHAGCILGANHPDETKILCRALPTVEHLAGRTDLLCPRRPERCEYQWQTVEVAGYSKWYSNTHLAMLEEELCDCCWGEGCTGGGGEGRPDGVFNRITLSMSKLVQWMLWMNCLCWIT